MSSLHKKPFQPITRKTIKLKEFLFFTKQFRLFIDLKKIILAKELLLRILMRKNKSLDSMYHYN